MGITYRFQGILLFLLSICIGELSAQQVTNKTTAEGEFIYLKANDGREIRLAAQADDDEDGIENTLEINGFTYTPQDGLQAWDGDESKTYFKTDPLRWSTDGDPYSDFMEVSGVNMPAGVPSPENKPLVAARPVISIGMDDYDVILISEITNTEGGEESSSYTNETSQTDEVGGEVTVGAELNPFKLASVEVTASYSHSWTRTESSTSSFGTNWSNTRSTNPSMAARLKLRIYMKNLGSATALDVSPTFNLVLGEKTIATITPNQVADRLAPNGLPRSRYPETGTIVVEKDNDNNDLILSLEELKAIQSGAPLGLVVTQVQADVARWNSDTQSFDSREGWSSFEGEIDPVVVNLKANLGDNDIYNYQIYVGTDFYDLGLNFQDVLSEVFELEESNGVTTIAGRRYPDDWYVSTPSEAFLDEWRSQGEPENLLPITMFRNTKIVMMSPGSEPAATVDLATFSPDFRKVYVSAFPGNFPILSARAQVTVNGQQREVNLIADENSFFTNTTAFEDAADVDGKVFIENARGDVTEATITLPALYQNAREVKNFEALLPSPGGEYLLFLNGDVDKPVKLYCLFEDTETGDTLETAREYLTLPQNSDTSNFSDRRIEGIVDRIQFNKIRLDPGTLMVDGLDFTFAESMGSLPTFGDPLYGSVYRCNPFDELYANIDLTDTPFHLDPYTVITSNTITIDSLRKVLNVFPLTEGNASPTCGTAGIQGNAVLAYDDFADISIADGLARQSLQFNTNSTGADGYVNMGTSNTLEVSDAITLEAWIKPEAHARGTFSQGVFFNKEGEYEISRFADGTIRWALSIDSPNWLWINTHYIANENEWVHVALTYDQSEPESSVRVYINGNLFHGSIGSGTIGDHPTHENQDSFRIANREGTDSTPYAGRVDEVRVWNIARTNEQIRAAIGDTLGPEIYQSAESGLIGYWRFDALEDLGTGGDGADDVRDYSVNGNHGDLVGDVQLSDITTGVDDEESNLPEAFTLEKNYPNPFNPQTRISFILPEMAEVKLQIFNLKGQKVATILEGVQPAGEYTATWSGRDNTGRQVASGIYVYRLQAGKFAGTRKMTLVR